MSCEEIPLSFECLGARLVGVLALPPKPASAGVIIVVGGPQYRVGSHRQFVLLARALASAGIACLRFDYRGMGDSEGDCVAFEATAPDIDAAIGALRARVPAVTSVVLWGLCDGAAAAAFAAGNPDVAGLALVNPWVRTEHSESEATLKHYYGRRFSQPDFWRKLFSGKMNIPARLRELSSVIACTLARRTRVPAGQALPWRVGQAIRAHSGPVLVMLSGNDRTASEFRINSARPGPLADALQRPDVTIVEVPDADHTFSSARWRDEAASATLAWLQRQFGMTHSPGS